MADSHGWPATAVLRRVVGHHPPQSVPLPFLYKPHPKRHSKSQPIIPNRSSKILKNPKMVRYRHLRPPMSLIFVALHSSSPPSPSGTKSPKSVACQRPLTRRRRSPELGFHSLGIPKQPRVQSKHQFGAIQARTTIPNRSLNTDSGMKVKFAAPVTDTKWIGKFELNETEWWINVLLTLYLVVFLVCLWMLILDGLGHHTYHTRSVFAAAGLVMVWLVNVGFVQHMKTLILRPAVIPWWLAKALNPIGPFTSLFVIAALYQRDNAMTTPSVDDQLHLHYFFVSALCTVFLFLMMFAPVTTDMGAFYPLCGFAFGRTLMIGVFSTRTWCTGSLCAILMFVRGYVETHAVVVAHRRGAPVAAAAGGEQVDATAGGEPVVAAGGNSDADANSGGFREPLLS